MIFSQEIETPLGRMFLSGSEAFLHSADFNNTEINFEHLNGSCALLEEATSQIAAFFEGKLMQFDLPCSQKGTDFQHSVWDLLNKIPFGTTASYADMALNLGNLKSIRAAASANGKNRLAIIVPCHRVIGSDGKLVGYAGGLWRKEWLLDHERKHSGKPIQLGIF